MTRIGCMHDLIKDIDTEREDWDGLDSYQTGGLRRTVVQPHDRDQIASKSWCSSAKIGYVTNMSFRFRHVHLRGVVLCRTSL